MDGGASSSDPFRLPAESQELTYPFGNGLLVRYGHTPRLVASTVSVAGFAAEFPPSIQEPYRLLHFVVTDPARAALTALRAVLKDGLDVPDRPATALVIDTLHTVEVYRRQGLATSLTNFVKGIAEAHGFVLYASCGVYCKSYWEARGYGEETSTEVLRVCNRGDDFGYCTALLRAGERYAGYHPACGEQPSSIELFVHGQGVDVAPSDTIIGDGGSGGSVVDMDNAAATMAKKIMGEAPTLPAITSAATPSGSAGGVAAAAADNNGGGTAPAFAYRHSDPAGGAPTAPVLTDARLARHDEAEYAKRFPAPGLAASTSSAAAAAGAGAGGRCVDAEQGEAHAAQPNPGEEAFPDDRDAERGEPHALAHGCADVEAATARLGQGVKHPGWPSLQLPPPPPLNMSGEAAMRAVASADRPVSEEIAVRALTGLQESAPAPVVDLTGGADSKALAEQEEANMQLAIALSLSEAGGPPMAEAATTSGGQAPGDDTETDEDPGYGAHSSHESPGSGPISGAPNDASLGDAYASPYDRANGTRATMQAALPPAPLAWSSSSLPLSGARSFNGDRRCRRLGAEESGSDVSSGMSWGGGGGRGGGCGRGRDVSGRGRQDEDCRRIRRRRDESGTSTPGEQSPDGTGDDAATIGEKGCPGAWSGAEDGLDSGDGRPRDTLEGARAEVSRRQAVPAGRACGVSVATLTASPAINANDMRSEARDPAGVPVAYGADGEVNNATQTAHGSMVMSAAREERKGDGAGVLGGSEAVQAPAPQGLPFVGASDNSPDSTGCLPTVRARATTAVAANVAESAPDPMMVTSEPGSEPAARVPPAKVYVPPSKACVPRGDAAAADPVDHGMRPAGGVGLPRAAGLTPELESTEIWRDMGVGSSAMDDIRDSGAGDVGGVGSGGGGGGIGEGAVGAGGVGGVGGGGTLDELLIAANWERDDQDDELRRAVEASRLSLEEEMIRRATLESQQAAAVAAEAAATAAEETGVPCSSQALPLSSVGGSGPGPDPAAAWSMPSNGDFGGGERGVADVLNPAPRANGSSRSAVRIESGAGRWESSIGGSGGGNSGERDMVDSPAWDDGGEIVRFEGKGKGRCRE